MVGFAGPCPDAIVRMGILVIDEVHRDEMCLSATRKTDMTKVLTNAIDVYFDV
jgi:hypothetical protein